MDYNPDRIRQYFDEYGNEEYKRLVSSPKNLMTLAIHHHYLRKFIGPTDDVLELGAGAGRFSPLLVELGGSLVVSDLSQVQLDLNRARMEDMGVASSINEFLILDITNLEQIDDNSFDVTVAIGGPLSYVFNQRDVAMTELIRVTKPGGIIFLGVMSRYGSLQRVIRSYALDLVDANYTVEQILASGDDPGYLAFENHHAHLFTFDEIKQFLDDYPVKICESTATSYLTMQRVDALYEVVKDPIAWKKLVDLELQICKEMVDGGSHMLLVVKNLQ